MITGKFSRSLYVYKTTHVLGHPLVLSLFYFYSLVLCFLSFLFFLLPFVGVCLGVSGGNK